MHDKTGCSHEELEAGLSAAAAESNAAETHGLICGMICADGKASPESWLEYVLGEGSHESAAVWTVQELLHGLQAESLGQLHDESFGFVPLLPQDEMPLSQRTQALSSWCSGFLFGLALGGIREDVELPESVSEVMKDFYEISNAGFIADPEDESNEEAYNEIMEYVRMSVILMFEELQPQPAAPRLQ